MFVDGIKQSKKGKESHVNYHDKRRSFKEYLNVRICVRLVKVGAMNLQRVLHKRRAVNT